MATYYIEPPPTGNDSNPGTEVSPWATFAQATSVMVGGDTVYAKNGTYVETITTVRSGSAGNHIFYRAYPGHTPTVGSSYRSVTIDGHSYIAFYGLEMTYSGGGSDSGVFITNGANRITFEGCEIHNFEESGIETQRPGNPASHIYVHDCVIHNVGQTTGGGHGIIFYYSGNYSEIHNCTIYDIGPGIPQTYSSCVELCAADYVDVANNDLSGSDLHAVDVCEDSHDCVVWGNVCHDCTATGVALDNGAYDNTIRHNLIYGNGQPSGWGAGIYTWQSGAWGYPYDNIIYNNTIYDNDGATGGAITFEDALITGYVIKNNIIYGNNTPYEYYIVAAANLSDSDYNCFDTGTSIYYVGSGYDLAGYQSASSQDANSQADNPSFVDAGNNNFNLQAGSPCIDEGTDLGYPYHGTAPDQGALESSSPPPIGGGIFSGAVFGGGIVR